MDLDEYQEKAKDTDVIPQDGWDKILFAVLAMQEELGDLARACKNLMRDKIEFPNPEFQRKTATQLGHLLWYSAILADVLELKLSTVARDNIDLNLSRWIRSGVPNALLDFDAQFPPPQRLPRKVRLRFLNVSVDGTAKVQMRIEDTDLGDPLDDNQRVEDDYKYHDTLHWAFVAYLGWSPVIRKLLARKRKASSEMDQYEDSRRPWDKEETIVNTIYENAKEKGFYKTVNTVDTRILNWIRVQVGNLEVAKASAKDWEDAIIAGFRCHQSVVENNGGTIVVDRESKSLTYERSRGDVTDGQ